MVEGVDEDDKQAVYWYTKAAEQGLAKAQFNLGNRYAKGEGVAEDYVMAHMWFNIAAANGYENARKNKDIYVKTMSPSQIAKAQEMARECVAKNYKGC
jgi:TPR repeat protein